MIDPGAKVDPNYFVYKSGTENDVWVKTADGKNFHGDAWPGAAAFPDFTCPKVNKWWRNLYKDFMAQGVDGVWNDVNEPQINDTLPTKQCRKIISTTEEVNCLQAHIYNIIMFMVF